MLNAFTLSLLFRHTRVMHDYLEWRCWSKVLKWTASCEGQLLKNEPRLYLCCLPCFGLVSVSWNKDLCATNLLVKTNGLLVHRRSHLSAASLTTSSLTGFISAQFSDREKSSSDFCQAFSLLACLHLLLHPRTKSNTTAGGVCCSLMFQLSFTPQTFKTLACTARIKMCTRGCDIPARTQIPKKTE